eukprot:COSAG05_NODE_646_length_8119_cov_236.689900_11_plen_146_part_00
MHSNRSIPSQLRVSQSSVDSVDCIYSCTRRSFSYGKILRRSVSYGKNYSEDLLARYSGTMHHANNLLWPRGRRGGCCCCSASQIAATVRTVRCLVRTRARTAVVYSSQSISSSRTLLATVLSSGKNTTTDSMRACMKCQKTQFLL